MPLAEPSEDLFLKHRVLSGFLSVSFERIYLYLSVVYSVIVSGYGQN